jgi:hypothetical protein
MCMAKLVSERKTKIKEVILGWKRWKSQKICQKRYTSILSSKNTGGNSVGRHFKTRHAELLVMRVLVFIFRLDKTGTRYASLFRFRSSPVIGSSSSARSAVSAGLSKEWTLLAMLDRRVAGSDESGCRGNLGPPTIQPLSALNVDGVVSAVRGGVACREPSCCCRLGPPISY